MEEPGEIQNVLKQVADKLFGYLRDTIYDPLNASLDIEDLPESFMDVGKALVFLKEMLTEARGFAKELSAGNLKCAIPRPSNELASSLKSLHATLTHLTWQAQQVAKGDYGQRVDFMGEFAVAFNNMTMQLEQQRQINATEKANLLVAVEDSTRARREAEYNHELMRIVNEAAKLLLESGARDYISALRRGMEMIGRFAKLDRVHMWRNIEKDDGKLYFQRVCSWSGIDGLGTAVEYSYQDTVPGWRQILMRDEIISGPVDDLPEQEKRFLSKHLIRSLAVIPIFVANNLWGTVSFDDCRRRRLFSDTEINILRSWGLLIVGAMQRSAIAQNLQVVSNNYKGLIWSVDNNRVITTFKGQYASILLPFAKEMEGNNISLIEDNADYLNIVSNVEKTFSEGPQNWINEVDGRVFHSYTTPLCDDNGAVIGVVGSTDDVSETERLQKALEDANRAKSDFLANMSHEIRTPMNAIIGMAELSLREDIPPVAQEYMLTIKQAGGNLLDIINDILDFSKIESGNIGIVRNEYMPSSLINDVVHIIKSKAHKPGLRFVVNIDNQIPAALEGDVKRIRQVMLNLLGNAVKYTDRGHVSLSVNMTPEGGDAIMLVIEVADSGSGIKQEDMAKLFDKFTRFDQARNRNVEGTGLGLAITKSVVEAMDGEIEVRSAPGQGSVFTVRLPQGIIDHRKLAVVDDVENKKVLIFERREVCRNSIVQTMEGLGVIHKLVATTSEFYNDLVSNAYSFVFVAAVLYERAKQEYGELKTDARIMLVAEFGEAVKEKNISVLTTPIFTLPVADFLNGVSYFDSIGASGSRLSGYVAPGVRILSVDDIKTNLTVLEGLLKPLRVQVTSCSSGLEALEAVMASRFDLIFMDHMMPDMDGVETTRKIRGMEGECACEKGIPIIALSANAVAGVRGEFLENGFDDFLPKPIDIARLNEILFKWIPEELWEKEEPVGDGAGSGQPGAGPGGDGAGAVGDGAGAGGDGAGAGGDGAGPGPQGAIEIKGVNISKGLARAGGSMENYIKTLTVFHKDSTEKVKEISSCLETANIPLFTIYVHALKSAASNIGAEGLAEAAEALESAGREGSIPLVRSGSPKLLADLEELRNNVGEALSGINGHRQGMPVDTELIKAELHKLKGAIDSFDSSLIKAIADSLRLYTHAAGFGAALDGILLCVLSGDDEKAISMIDELVISI